MYIIVKIGVLYTLSCSMSTAKLTRHKTPYPETNRHIFKGTTKHENYSLLLSLTLILSPERQESNHSIPFPQRPFHNIILVIASDHKERGNLSFSTRYEIASVGLLPRNFIMKQSLRERDGVIGQVYFLNQKPLSSKRLIQLTPLVSYVR